MSEPYAGRRVCVTGGAGFIGSHLVEALLEAGAFVTVLDDFSGGDEAGVPAPDTRSRVVRGSILDPAALALAAGDAEVIFHQAAITSVPASVEQPLRCHEVNATGTLRVLEAARLGRGRRVAGVRVVFASSSSIYGDHDRPALGEDLPPRPLSPYAASKAAGEMLVRAYAACYGIEAVSLRYFNVFGPRQRPDSPYAAVIPRFTKALLGGDRPVIYGDGGQTRDFTHVADVVRANLLAGASTRPLRGEAINVGRGAGATVRELLQALAAIIGVKADADHAPPRAGDVRHSRADISRAREVLGYEPQVTLDAGLCETVEWMRGG
jgi:nucleoside-diphosphate-sugar epimerase